MWPIRVDGLINFHPTLSESDGCPDGLSESGGEQCGYLCPDSLYALLREWSNWSRTQSNPCRIGLQLNPILHLAQPIIVRVSAGSCSAGSSTDSDSADGQCGRSETGV